MESWYEGAAYNRRFEFRFGDCNDREEASVFTIMKLLSEISGEDYEGRGLSHDVLLERGLVFLLSRFSLRFFRRPRHMEKTVATAWAREIKGPMFYRSYEIKNESGELLVAGASSWLLANPQTREILRPSACGELPEMNPKSVDCQEPKKLRRNTELSAIGTRPVFYSDIDCNGHVNNAIYGRIAEDFLSEAYRQRTLIDFFITFNLETKLSETLQIIGGESENSYALQGLVGDELHFATEFYFK